MRAAEPPLRYGRLYFREVSGNGQDFGLPAGQGGVIAFSRILADREVIVIANTHADRRFDGAVLVDYDLNPAGRTFTAAFSSHGEAANPSVQVAPGRMFRAGDPVALTIASLPVSLAPMAAQILVPANSAEGT